MRRRVFGVILTLMLLLDLYVFQVVRFLSLGCPAGIRIAIWSAYWALTLAVVVFGLLMPGMDRGKSVSFRNYVLAIILGLFLAKLVASAVFLVDDLRRGLLWVVGRDHGRSLVLSWIGVGLGVALFSILVNGFSNKYRYQVRRVTLRYPNLPAPFEGWKVVHISDIHSGSLMDKEAVENGINMILREKPECILFTGDLVNDRASEMNGYREVFARLKAPMGVFSTLGNHDYGDYTSWSGLAEKAVNLEELKDMHRQMGWRLLMNEHVVLERGGARIALLGVENWSDKGRFPRHGRMDLAYPGSEVYPFRVLMSHDPSHWFAEVLPRYPLVDLTLSGHTHGMQFGVEVPGFRWSPVKYMYKEWAGLYEEGKQKLYVNRGFGFIGYPGRVGILPEITVIEFQRSS